MRGEAQERRDRTALRALASKLGLELPALLPADAYLETIASEIRRRGWQLGDQHTARPAQHGTRSRYSAGCRCDPCRHANAIKRDLSAPGELPHFRLAWNRRP